MNRAQERQGTIHALVTTGAKTLSHSSRPGILVLVNDTDWELEGEGEYALKDGDELVFISTLHGG